MLVVLRVSEELPLSTVYLESCDKDFEAANSWHTESHEVFEMFEKSAGVGRGWAACKSESSPAAVTSCMLFSHHDTFNLPYGYPFARQK